MAGRRLGSALILVGFLVVELGCGPRTPVAQQRGGDDDLSADALEEEDGVADEDFDPTTEFDLSELESLSLVQLKYVALQREQEYTAVIEELQLLDGLNHALCQRLELLRRECKAAVRIKPDGRERQLQCSGSYSEGKRAAHVFEVELDIKTPGEYVLLVNSVYRSSKFKKGRHKIAFSTNGSAGELAPQLKTISSMVLRRLDGNKKIPDDPATVRLGFFVDGEQVLSGKMLFSQSRKHLGSELRVNLAQIQGVARSSKCRVDDNEIQDIKSSVTAQIKQRLHQQKKRELRGDQ